MAQGAEQLRVTQEQMAHIGKVYEVVHSIRSSSFSGGIRRITSTLSEYISHGLERKGIELGLSFGLTPLEASLYGGVLNSEIRLTLTAATDQQIARIQQELGSRRRTHQYEPRARSAINAKIVQHTEKLIEEARAVHPTISPDAYRRFFGIVRGVAHDAAHEMIERNTGNRAEDIQYLHAHLTKRMQSIIRARM